MEMRCERQAMVRDCAGGVVGEGDISANVF